MHGHRHREEVYFACPVPCQVGTLHPRPTNQLHKQSQEIIDQLSSSVYCYWLCLSYL